MLVFSIRNDFLLIIILGLKSSQCERLNDEILLEKSDSLNGIAISVAKLTAMGLFSSFGCNFRAIYLLILIANVCYVHTALLFSVVQRFASVCVRNAFCVGIRF